MPPPITILFVQSYVIVTFTLPSRPQTLVIQLPRSAYPTPQPLRQLAGRPPAPLHNLVFPFPHQYRRGRSDLSNSSNHTASLGRHGPSGVPKTRRGSNRTVESGRQRTKEISFLSNDRHWYSAKKLLWQPSKGSICHTADRNLPRVVSRA
jgi:hypothetical protein